MCARDHGDPHDTPLVDQVHDPQLVSLIQSNTGDHGLRPYIFSINVYISAPSSVVVDGVNYDCESLPGGQAGKNITAAWFDDFKSAVHRVWNNKIWLGPAGVWPDDDPGLLCGINLHHVETSAEADLHLRVINCPVRPFESPKCEIGGIDARSRVDMYLEAPDHNQPDGSSNVFDTAHEYPTSDRGNVTFTQSRAAHELGHYLKLHHTCYARTHEDRSEASYCANGTFEQQNGLMSSGNAMRTRYGTPWIERLSRHHYHCGLTWRAHLNPSSAPAARERGRRRRRR